MRYYCPNCMMTFESESDCVGDACNRCDDGIIEVDDYNYFEVNQGIRCNCGGKYPHELTCPQSAVNEFFRAGGE